MTAEHVEPTGGVLRSVRAPSGSKASVQARTPLTLDGRVQALRASASTLISSAPGSTAAAWEHDVRERVIAELDAVMRDLTVYRGDLLLAHREDGRWGSARDRDFTAWRARTTGAGRGRASGELLIADGLAAMPTVKEAVTDGRLGLAQADALARARAQASDAARATLDEGGLADLVERASASKLSAPELAKAAAAVVAEADSAAAQASFDATWRRRQVTFGKAAGGGRSGQWLLDDVGGTLIETALDAVVGTVAADDDRTRSQRHADALVTMASRVLQVGSDLNGAQVRPHLALVVEEATWAAARDHQVALDAASGQAVEEARGSGAAFGLSGTGRQQTLEDLGGAPRDTHSGAGACPPLLAVPEGVASAELEDGTLVPVRELLRVMCDCELTRVVMDAESKPVDVGTTQRTYARELRRAITARDRTCRWPSCQIRAAWCEVHHITWWSRGGTTSIGNGVTMCTYHHHVVHADNLRIVPLADGVAFYRRDGSLLGTRGTDRRRAGSRAAANRGGVAAVGPLHGGRACDEPPDGGAPDGRLPRGGEHDQLLAAWQQVRDSNGRDGPRTWPVAAAEGTALPGGGSPLGGSAPGGSPPGGSAPGGSRPIGSGPGGGSPPGGPPPGGSPPGSSQRDASPQAGRVSPGPPGGPSRGRRRRRREQSLSDRGAGGALSSFLGDQAGDPPF